MVCPNCGTLNTNEAENCRKCAKTLHPAFMKGKIPCRTHANREATTSCGVCGARLCAACAINHNGIDYCDACAPAAAVRPDFDADYEGLAVVNTDTTGRAMLQPRVWAFLIDLFMFLGGAAVFGVVSFLWTTAQWVFNPRAGYGFPLFWTIMIVLWTAYNAISVAMSGQTRGMRVNNVIVLMPNGHIADARAATIRALVSLVSFACLGLGYIWAFFDPLRETWHDKVAGTAVYEYEEVS